MLQRKERTGEIGLRSSWVRFLAQAPHDINLLICHGGSGEVLTAQSSGEVGEAIARSAGQAAVMRAVRDPFSRGGRGRKFVLPLFTTLALNTSRLDNQFYRFAQARGSQIGFRTFTKLF
jgi:hypothetical protein